MTAPAGEGLGMRVSPEDPRLIVLDDGTTVTTRSPVVELFVCDGIAYARTRPPGAGADVVRAVRWPATRDAWDAVLRYDTRIAVDGASLVTPKFTREFPAPVRCVVELSDGAFVVVWRFVREPHGMGRFAPAPSNVAAFERDGTPRWTGRFGDVYAVTRVGDTRLPDLLVVQADEFVYYAHPWDGRTILSRWTK